MSNIYRLPESFCARCDYRMNASAVNHGPEGPPIEGDSCLCMNCGQVLIYQADLTLRKITIEELRELMTESPESWAAIEIHQRAISERGRFA